MKNGSLRGMPGMEGLPALALRYVCMPLLLCCRVPWTMGCWFLTVSVMLVSSVIWFLFFMFVENYSRPAPPVVELPAMIRYDAYGRPVFLTPEQEQKQREQDAAIAEEALRKMEPEIRAWRGRLAKHEAQFLPIWLFLKIYFLGGLAVAGWVWWWGPDVSKQSAFSDGVSLLEYLACFEDTPPWLIRLLWEPAFCVAAGVILRQWYWPLGTLVLICTACSFVMSALMLRMARSLRISLGEAIFGHRWTWENVRRPEQQEEEHTVRPHF